MAAMLSKLPEGALEVVEHVVNHLVLAVVEHGPLLFSMAH